MYGPFIMIGERLSIERYKADPRITSLPEKLRPPALPAPKQKPEQR